MKIEVLLEMTKFSEKINQLSSEIIEAIKPNLFAKHSTRTEHDKNNNYTPYEVKQEIKSIIFNINLSVEYGIDLITKKQSECSLYELRTMVVTDYGNIIDGQVERWVWDVLQTKMEFDEFPNFDKPKFSDDGKQIVDATEIMKQL